MYTKTGARGRCPQKYTWDVILYIVYTDGEAPHIKNNVIVYKLRTKLPIYLHDCETNSCTTDGTLGEKISNKLCINYGPLTVSNAPLKAALRLSEAHPIAGSLMRDTCVTFLYGDVTQITLSHTA